jgi:hypothetical protein
MAQEVQKIEPSAVWRDHNRYLVVNYDWIRVKFMTWKERLARTSDNWHDAIFNTRQLLARTGSH